MSPSLWEAYLKEYQAKVDLEEYQLNRTLPRPSTTKRTVAALVLLLLLMVAGACLLFANQPLPSWASILLCGLCIVGILETYGRLLGIKIVECYQHYASEETRRKCKCVPSCSEYAILCLKKYELIYALQKIRKRLFITCKGFDYILDDP
jgi:putative component of membrane protein insertase Oxa1/YidC/SpoIIIJ protein YidD